MPEFIFSATNDDLNPGMMYVRFYRKGAGDMVVEAHLSEEQVKDCAIKFVTAVCHTRVR